MLSHFLGGVRPRAVALYCRMHERQDKVFVRHAKKVAVCSIPLVDVRGFFANLSKIFGVGSMPCLSNGFARLDDIFFYKKIG